MPASETRRRQTAVAADNGTPPGGMVLKRLSPAAPGATRLALRHGGALVCVRYREDEARGRRFTTVELMVDARPIPPPAAARVAFEETELRGAVKAAGGTWDAKRKLWVLPGAAIRKLKLKNRIVPEKA